MPKIGPNTLESPKCPRMPKNTLNAQKYSRMPPEIPSKMPAQEYPVLALNSVSEKKSFHSEKIYL